MEVSAVYEMLLHAKIGDYRESLANEENNFAKWERKYKEALEKSLNEKQLNLLKDYLHSLLLLEEEIDYQVGIRTLNWGIKIGIQLQHSIMDLYKYLDDPDDYE